MYDLQCIILCVSLGDLLKAAFARHHAVPFPPAFVAMHFLRALEYLCHLLHIQCPVTGITERGGWYVLTLLPNAMQRPTARSLEVAAAKSLDIELLSGRCTLDDVQELPPTLYHGTTPETLLLILLEGRFASAGTLGMHRHTPDGLYSYPCPVVSAKSCYVEQGCQIKFNAACFAISKRQSKLVELVPEGIACRMYRSENERSGQKGIEWVVNPRSCQIEGASVLTTHAHRLMQAVTASVADLSAAQWQPPLAPSSSSLSPSAASCSPRFTQRIDKARYSITDHIVCCRLQRCCACAAVAALNVHKLCIRQLLFHCNACLHDMRSTLHVT